MHKLSNTNPPSFTIVIVEDSIPYRTALCRVLKTKFPFACLIEAGSVEAALRMYPEPGADLMFVDIHLPDGNGLDLVRALHRRPGNPEFCLMTVYDVPEYRLAAHDCGATHFLAKATSTSADIIAVFEATMTQRARARRRYGCRRARVADEDAIGRVGVTLDDHGASGHSP